jgi:hypothetical protein
MNIVIDEQNLTAVIHDDADNPTKECILGNWNPIDRRPWISVEELKSFAEHVCCLDNYFHDYVAPADEPIAEEPVADEPIIEPVRDADGTVM